MPRRHVICPSPTAGIVRTEFAGMVTDCNMPSWLQPLTCPVFSGQIVIPFDGIGISMSLPPGWLKELADATALLMMPADVMAPIGCHYCCVDDTWEISLFVSSTEIVGGERDGDVRRSRFCLDVEAVKKLLDEVHGISWQAQSLASDDELGPHVELCG